MPDNQSLAYDPDGAAQAANTSRTRIYQAISTGELKSFKDGRRRRITRKALEDWIAKLERAGDGRRAAA
jgi:excisionase family DNA binding protein